MVLRQDKELAEAHPGFVRVEKKRVQGRVSDKAVMAASNGFLENQVALPFGVLVVNVGGRFDEEEEKDLESLM